MKNLEKIISSVLILSFIIAIMVSCEKEKSAQDNYSNNLFLKFDSIQVGEMHNLALDDYAANHNVYEVSFETTLNHINEYMVNEYDFFDSLSHSDYYEHVFPYMPFSIDSFSYFNKLYESNNIQDCRIFLMTLNELDNFFRSEIISILGEFDYILLNSDSFEDGMNNIEKYYNEICFENMYKGEELFINQTYDLLCSSLAYWNAAYDNPESPWYIYEKKPIDWIRKVLKGAADVVGFVVGGVVSGYIFDELDQKVYTIGPDEIPFNIYGGISVGAALSAGSFNE